MVKLDILSDPVCPWCYIGKGELDKALAQKPDHPFTIEWHPFQLNPEMPAEGAPNLAYYEAKFGKGNFEGMVDQVKSRAAALGMPMDFDSIRTKPNTLNAHRLIHWAGIEQKQTEAVDALFHAYWAKGRDIGDIDVLAAIAGEIGMDRDAVLALLNSAADQKEISDRDAHSRKMGVNSVPTFIVANQHAVPGAQPAEMWVSVIDDIEKQLDDANPNG